MLITDYKYPEFVKYQLGAGKAYIPCGYSYEFRENNNTTRKIFSGLVYTYPIAEFLTTPEAGHFAETDFFKVLQFPNGYSIRMKFIAFSNGYVEMAWRTFDQNDNELGSGAVTGMSGGRGSGSALLSDSYGTPFADFTTCCVKVAGYTYFPLNTDVGVSAIAFGFDAYFGRMSDLYLPNSEVIYEPMSYSPKVIKFLMTTYAIGGLFRVADFDQMENFMLTHGNPYTPMPMWESGPVNQNDNSEEGGGDGNYNDDSDPIDFPANPLGGALSCGAIKAFSVTPTTIAQLFQKLWSTNVFDIATWQKLVANPLDCIVSLHCLPVQAQTTGNQSEIKVGNFETELMADVIGNQYIQIPCGKINLIKFFGSALDYHPYCTCQIYLPFSGIHTLKIEDVQGATIEVKYNIDVLTGDCVINVKCGQSVLYKFTGNCKMPIPITSRSDNFLPSLITGGAAVVGTALTGASGGTLAARALGSAANVALRKVEVSRSGQLVGNTGLLDDFRPYLIIHRPQQSLAKDYNKFKGYPSNITATLGELSGYTEVEHIHLGNIPNATAEEIDALMATLKEGIII